MSKKEEPRQRGVEFLKRKLNIKHRYFWWGQGKQTRLSNQSFVKLFQLTDKQPTNDPQQSLNFLKQRIVGPPYEEAYGVSCEDGLAAHSTPAMESLNTLTAEGCVRCLIKRILYMLKMLTLEAMGDGHRMSQARHPFPQPNLGHQMGMIMSLLINLEFQRRERD